MAEVFGTSKNIELINQCQKEQNGKYGTVFINDTSVTSGPFWRLNCLTDCVVDSISATGIDNSSDISSGTTYSAGTNITGEIETIQMVTGQVLAYRTT